MRAVEGSSGDGGSVRQKRVYFVQHVLPLPLFFDAGTVRVQN